MIIALQTILNLFMIKEI
ncbi:hypothetical protein [Nostoc sp.]